MLVRVLRRAYVGRLRSGPTQILVFVAHQDKKVVSQPSNHVRSIEEFVVLRPRKYEIASENK